MAESETSVVASGLGGDLEGAVQNAAENALVQVVGSFVDSSRSSQKRTEINNSIREQVKTVSSTVSEYSQGSIKSIEVLEVDIEDGLTRVTANVTIRADEFEAYIKKDALGEATVNKGLINKSILAQQEQAQAQSEGLKEIIVDRILADAQSLKVHDVEVGQLNLVSDPALDVNIRKFMTDNKMALHEFLLRLPVKVTLSGAFFKNATETMERTARYGFKGTRIPGNKKLWGSDLQYMIMFADFASADSALPVSPDSIDLFRVAPGFSVDVDWEGGARPSHQIADRNQMQIYSFAEDQVPSLCEATAAIEGLSRIPFVQLSVLDGSGSEVVSDRIAYKDSRNKWGSSVPDLRSDRSLIMQQPAGYSDELNQTWEPRGTWAVIGLLDRSEAWGTTQKCYVGIDTVSSFDIVFSLTPEELESAESIQVRLTR